MSSAITIGVFAWTVTALCCYLFLRRTLYNLLDPLAIVNIAIPFSAALLAVLCSTDLISGDKLTMFALLLLAYLSGARTAGAFFGREPFRQSIMGALAEIRRNEATAILVVTAGVTLLLALLGLQAGAEGDARLAFGRVFRPILLVQNGLFLFALVLLLSPSMPTIRAWLWLLLLLALSIPFSGKSILLPAVFWFGIKLFLSRRRITLRTALWMLAVVIGGVTVMGVIAYSTSSPSTAFLLFTNRLWMSGDVYIFAYQRDALASIHANYPVSFLAYIMHPITSLVGVRGYEKPLGSMLASEVMRDDVLTGPNPQLPVVLDYFFPDAYWATLPIAFVTGFVVIGIRPLGMTLASRARSRYLRLGAIAAALFAPAAGFLDTSLVLIALVGIVAATALLVAIELTLPRQQDAPSERCPPSADTFARSRRRMWPRNTS